MVNTISFIQAILQHSVAASGIFTRTVGIKGIDVALVQEPRYHEDCIRGLIFQDIPCILQEKRIDPEPVPWQGT